MKDEFTENSKRYCIPTNMIAGGIAGMIAKTVVAPVDRIKILYQISSARFRLRDLPSVGYHIVQNEGFTALWKGNSATLVRVFPYAGIQFSVFNSMKSFFVERGSNGMESDASLTEKSDRKWSLSPMESLLSGATAGVVSVLCTYPLDLTRAQLAVLKKNDGSRHGFVEVLGMNYKKGVRPKQNYCMFLGKFFQPIEFLFEFLWYRDCGDFTVE